MKTVILISLLTSLAACNNQHFAKKPEQTNDQYRNDMMYCKGEAVGAWNDRNGVSKLNIQKGEMGVISYEDCMRQLGYQQGK